MHTNLGKTKFVSGMFTSYYEEEAKNLCRFMFIFIHLDSLSFNFNFIFPISIVKVLTKCTCVWYNPLFFLLCENLHKCQNPLFFFLFFFFGGCILLVLGEFFFQISKKEELPYFDLDFSLGLTTLVLYPFRFGLGLEMKDSVSERGLSFTTAHAVRFGLG